MHRVSKKEKSSYTPKLMCTARDKLEEGMRVRENIYDHINCNNQLEFNASLLITLPFERNFNVFIMNWKWWRRRSIKFFIIMYFRGRSVGTKLMKRFFVRNFKIFKNKLIECNFWDLKPRVGNFYQFLNFPRFFFDEKFAQFNKLKDYNFFF